MNLTENNKKVLIELIRIYLEYSLENKPPRAHIDRLSAVFLVSIDCVYDSLCRLDDSNFITLLYWNDETISVGFRLESNAVEFIMDRLSGKEINTADLVKIGLI